MCSSSCLCLRILCNHDHYFVNWKHTVLKLFVNCFKKKNRISCKFLVIYFRLFHKMNTLFYQSYRGYYINMWAATEVSEIFFETSTWWWWCVFGQGYPFTILDPLPPPPLKSDKNSKWNKTK